MSIKFIIEIIWFNLNVLKLLKNVRGGYFSNKDLILVIKNLISLFLLITLNLSIIILSGEEI